MNLEDLMLTDDEILEVTKSAIASWQSHDAVARAAVAKFAWGLVDWLNARGDFMKDEVEPDRAAELWWASGTIVEALQAAGIQRPVSGAGG